jgi:hypothetical protein
MKEDVDTQLEAIDFFIRDILDDMNDVTKSTTKLVILAHISAWKTTLKTIKNIIDIQL